MQFKILIAALLAPLAMQAQAASLTCCCRKGNSCPGSTLKGSDTDCGSLCANKGGATGACFVGAC